MHVQPMMFGNVSSLIWSHMRVLITFDDVLERRSELNWVCVHPVIRTHLEKGKRTTLCRESDQRRSLENLVSPKKDKTGPHTY